MATKLTMIFNYVSNSRGVSPITRTGGWTESWYDPGAFTAEMQTDFNRLCRRRAALLPDASAIIGQRYQQVDPVGASSTASATFAGNVNNNADVPQMALLIRVGSNLPNIKQFIMRGVPDSQIIKGEFVPGGDYNAAIQGFLRTLNGWSFRGRGLSAATSPIWTVSDSGEFVLTDNFTFAVNDIVRVLRTTNANGDQVGGRFRVQTHTSAVAGAFSGWNLGACTGGNVRLDTIVYPEVALANINISRAIVRKVGSPFAKYRGRRSKAR